MIRSNCFSAAFRCALPAKVSHFIEEQVQQRMREYAEAIRNGGLDFPVTLEIYRRDAQGGMAVYRSLLQGVDAPQVSKAMH